ncbi:TRAP transporter substrate-binding protein [Neobacillus mesonae]|uniref:TRAP transporter substrate-binding protein n=1 Tax=Neobacillus mesonae TaxID=1193713 RepID=UPI00203A88C4|nr:TRAP transporter substrate-binding protein [Neobacillus mesonae]MCM3569359.1 TRAP transporter substrate-binding protein [Neobacillus mesonae]
MKMKSFKTISIFIASVMLLLLTACGSNSANGGSKEKSKVLKMKSADVVSAKSPYSTGMDEFFSNLKKDTNGKIDVKHFPAGQLGNEAEIIEGVKLGTLGFALTGSIPDVPATQAMSLPYLFEDSDHMHRVLDGEIGKKLGKRIEEKAGVKVIGYVYFAPRVLTVKGKNIKTPEDLKGLKIRVPNNQISIATWKALGASPTPMAFTEVFSGLQQGVIDGQENPYELIASSSLYEVQDTVIETYHAMPVRYLIMNKKTYDSLSKEEKDTIEKDWATASKAIEKKYKEEEAKYIQTLKEHGMKFIKPDIQAFKEATKDVWKDIAPEAFGDGVYEEIQALRKEK